MHGALAARVRAAMKRYGKRHKWSAKCRLAWQRCETARHARGRSPQQRHWMRAGGRGRCIVVRSDRCRPQPRRTSSRPPTRADDGPGVSSPRYRLGWYLVAVPAFLAYAAWMLGPICNRRSCATPRSPHGRKPNRTDRWPIAGGTAGGQARRRCERCHRARAEPSLEPRSGRRGEDPGAAGPGHVTAQAAKDDYLRRTEGAVIVPGSIVGGARGTRRDHPGWGAGGTVAGLHEDPGRRPGVRRRGLAPSSRDD